MREVLPQAARWARSHRSFAVATVAGVRGSAPRPLGSSMLIGADGAVFGNISGGCVEGDVIDAGLDALASGRACVRHYGISEDAVFGVGLMCGGEIDVLVRPVPAGSDAARQLIALSERAEGDIVFALELSGGAPGRASILEQGMAGMDAAAGDAAALAGTDRAQVLRYDADGCRVGDPTAERSVLVVPFGQPPQLVVIGAVEYAVALARLGAAMGMRVCVVDPRLVFAVPERFPGAEVVCDWPQRYLAEAALDGRAAICVLSHDPKIDEPALQAALSGPAGYVGAMGSRRTHEDRLARLTERGVTADQLRRLRSPIGLDLGGRSSEETALSILAEIVALRHGGSGRALTEVDGPVHGDRPMRSASARTGP